MDLLIKDLALPKNGAYDYNITVRPDGTVVGWHQVGVRIVRIDTLAVEIPSHGDLKDENVVKDMVVKKLGIKSLDFLCEAEKVVVKCIEQAPTVLEATDGHTH